MTQGFKQHWEDFIQFAATQKRGIAWILLLSLLLILSVPIYSLFSSKATPHPLSADDKIAIDQLFAQQEGEATEQISKFADEVSYNNDSTTPQFFPFDPNTLSADDFKKLGLNKGQIKSILKLRNKFNGFKRKTDFEKLSVLDAQWVLQAHNYIQLPDSFEKRTYQKKDFIILDLNTADSIQLETLPGIGKFMAAKIVKYRERLGGFISMEQMQKITNMDNDIYNIAATHLCIKQPFARLNINSASKSTMGNHPYIGWKAANNIINYRKQHKKFTEPTELVRAKLLPDSSMQKLVPYLIY